MNFATCPLAEKIHSKRKFGFVDGELRGQDITKLINPPIEIDDLYHWIRDDTRTNPKVLEHLNAENNYTNSVLQPHNDLKNALYNEIKSYIRENYDTYASKHNLNANWLYFRRFYEGLAYHSHWRKIVLPDGSFKEEELLNINLLAKDKKQCDVTSFDISPNHNYMSYGVDYDGSERYEFVLVNLETHQQIPTPIPKLAYCSYFWANDTMIYYLVGDESNRIYQLWLWDMTLNANTLIFEELNPEYDISCGLSRDENYVIISSGNYDSNWCKYIEWKINPFEIKDFLPMVPNVKYSIESHHNYWLIHTNYNAVNWQITKIHKNSNNILWSNLEQFILPNDVVNVSGFEVFENYIVFKTKINGGTYLNITNLDRIWVKVLTHLENKVYTWNDYISLDFANIKTSLVYNISIGSNPIYTEPKLNIMFSSMISPTKLFDYNVETLENTLVYEQIVPNYNQDIYESKRLWVACDGTRLGIPVSIVYRKDLVSFNGFQKSPLYLYGYGSYGMTINPDFNHKILPLLDRGYIYAIMHVRGGGFLGYDWYEDGRMYKKINTFLDVIKCTEYFKSSNYVDSNKIVIEGRSAGGLLVGASITMRPDLFWIGIPGVPFVDVLNTMSDSSIPLTKEEWTQWGNPNETDGYSYIKQYCPYTNVRNTSYPHMYCTAGLHDPRVPYWEIIKLVAKIREHKTDANYQVLRIETTQGHFGGSSRYKSIEELAEKYAFIFTRS